MELRELKRFDLDERAAGYLRQRLSDLSAWKENLVPFCTALSDRIAAGGKVSTWAPPEIEIERLYQFEIAGLLPENLDMSRAIDLGDSKLMPVESLREEELAHVRRAIGESAMVCIVADPVLSEGDEVIRKYYLGTAFFAGDAVLHVIDATTPENSVAHAFVAPPFWTDLRVLTPVRPAIDANRRSSVDDLRKSASAAVTISCSAYDGEGFVAWREAER